VGSPPARGKGDTTRGRGAAHVNGGVRRAASDELGDGIVALRSKM
jgi:hypothetical protein